MTDRLPTCRHCHRTMAPGVSCDPLAFDLADGTTAPRQRYGFDGSGLPWQDPCNDCGAPLGGYHHAGCDCDICPHGQALGCDDYRTAEPGERGEGRSTSFRASHFLVPHGSLTFVRAVPIEAVRGVQP